MARHSNDQTLKEAINDMLKAFRLDDKMKQIIIIDSWEKVMGASVAKRTEELKFYGKKLFIKLNSASLRQELFLERDKIKKLLNAEADGEIVGEIVFQ